MIIVSNRLPVRVEHKERKLSYNPSIGGVATGLDAIHKMNSNAWIGWPGIETEDKNLKAEVEQKLKNEFNYIPVFLSVSDVRRFYYGFSNRTIWPLFHYFPQYCVYEKSEWEAYSRVNQLFCDKVAEIAGPQDTIWVHDYHLMLLPQLLRQKLPDTSIGFFLHIPFPSMEIFRYLPWCKEILRGILGADLVGFHTYGYARHFLSSVSRLLGVEHEFSEISLGNRRIRVDTFPMGIDVERFTRTAHSDAIKRRVAFLHEKAGHRKIILSVDRLDYTKGILKRLEAFGVFLEKYTDWHEKIKFILICTPSRTRVTQYQLLKKSVDELVGRINGQYGRIGWTPIWYLYRTQPFDRLVSLYCAADVALTTPLRDGMNLIAKEYLVSQVDSKGVLILSEMAGASSELGEAIIVNPNDIEQVASAINTALLMSDDEQIIRNKAMQSRLHRYNIFRWTKDFTDSLAQGKKLRKDWAHKKLSPSVLNELINHYRQSARRLLLLDYDGTLVPIESRPERAIPDDRLFNLLKQLSATSKNTVIVISGRAPDILEKWLGSLKINLIAEHGTWVREMHNNKWKILGQRISNDLKERIRSVLEVFVDRTPGALIEEKSLGLAWHYRMADPEMGSLRARELLQALKELVANTPLQVITGKKVIEVRTGGINKGRAALKWISKGWDFILAIGDDETDEDLFKVLPDSDTPPGGASVWSIKVGLTVATKARFSLESPNDTLSLLETLTGR